MKNSFSSQLIYICTIFTIVSFFYWNILEFWMNSEFLHAWEYLHVFFQFAFYQFLHWSIAHLLSNSLFLYIFWNQLEIYMWKRKYILFFLINTLFSWFAIMIFSRANTIWISSFAMAILGYMFLVLRNKNHPDYKSAWFLLALNVLIWISWNISFVWHAAWAIFWFSFYFTENLFKKLKTN